MPYRILIAVLMGLASSTAQAGVNFYTTTNSFAAATGALMLRGGENWSSAGNATSTTLSDPLSPGIPNGPFLLGSSITAGVQVQSNSLGGNPTNTAPGFGLFFAPKGFVGKSANQQPSDQVSANITGTSFDMIFQSLGASIPRAVSFSPMFYQLGINSSAALTIRVYDPSNNLLGSTTVSNVQDCLENAYLGIVTTAGDALGRVNVWATTNDTSGADNIAVYADLSLTPTLHALNWVSNNFTARLDGVAGLKYAILSSSDLIAWDYVQTNLLASNSMTLGLPATNALRFYRALWLP